MKNPCNRCPNAYEYKTKKRTFWHPQKTVCWQCQQRKEYLYYLESRRKYEKGAVIPDIAKLCECLERDGYVFWRHKILHRGFVESWQLHMILESIKAGVFREAILKEKKTGIES